MYLMRQQVTTGWKRSGDGEAEDRLNLFWVEYKLRSKIFKVQSRKRTLIQFFGWLYNKNTLAKQKKS